MERTCRNCSGSAGRVFTLLWTRRSVSSLPSFTFLAAALLVAGCGRPPIHTTLPAPTLRSQTDGDVTHDGVTVSVTPITGQNFRQYSQISPSFQIAGPRGQSTTWRGIIIPLPAFHVRIVNNTGHVLRFTQVIMQLRDNLGNRSQPYPNRAELLAWAQSVYTPVTSQNPALSSQLSSAVGQFQLLNRDLELLNGDEWAGFLVFRTAFTGYPNVGITEYRNYMDSFSRLTLRMAEVPVETNEAGQTSRTTEFSFVFDRTQFPLPVTCPARTREPSWDTCEEADTD